MSISQNSADRIVEEDVEHADPDQGHREEATGPGRGDRGGHPVLRACPDEPAQDPAAVEREGRDEVEEEQEQVDGGDPLDDDDHQRRRVDGARTARLAAMNTAVITSVIAGPIAATSISVLPVIQSPLIWATPPKSQSLMPSTAMPRRRASSAWPSS